MKLTSDEILAEFRKHLEELRGTYATRQDSPDVNISTNLIRAFTLDDALHKLDELEGAR